MSTLTSAPPPIQPEQLRRWTCEEYYRAAELGLFAPDERLELLEGDIYTRMPEKPIHSALIDEVEAALVAAFATQDFHCRVQHPVHLPNDSEPEPDIAVVRGKARDYRKNHPVANDVLLLVEVANSSVDLDYGKKRRIYANAGIREYWIVNIRESVVEVYRNPELGFEKPFATYRAGDTITPLAAPGAPIAVADFLLTDEDDTEESQ